MGITELAMSQTKPANSNGYGMDYGIQNCEIR